MQMMAQIHMVCVCAYVGMHVCMSQACMSTCVSDTWILAAGQPLRLQLLCLVWTVCEPWAWGCLVVRMSDAEVLPACGCCLAAAPLQGVAAASQWVPGRCC